MERIYGVKMCEISLSARHVTEEADTVTYRTQMVARAYDRFGKHDHLHVPVAAYYY